MRNQYVQTNSRAKAIKLMPWAAYILKVTDGYMGFECYEEYKTHLNQK